MFVDLRCELAARPDCQKTATQVSALREFLIEECPRERAYCLFLVARFQFESVAMQQVSKRSHLKGSKLNTVVTARLLKVVAHHTTACTNHLYQANRDDDLAAHQLLVGFRAIHFLEGCQTSPTEPSAGLAVAIRSSQ